MASANTHQYQMLIDITAIALKPRRAIKIVANQSTNQLGVIVAFHNTSRTRFEVEIWNLQSDNTKTSQNFEGFDQLAYRKFTSKFLKHRLIIDLHGEV